MKNIKILQGSIFHFLRAPTSSHDTGSYQYFDDGLLVIEAGKIKAVGETQVLRKTLPKEVEVEDYSHYLIMPGFIDTHIHYAQTEIIASYGEHLLEWLEKYVFPAEGKYDNQEYAARVAEFFLEELLRNGTTTAAIFSTVHASAADILFNVAQQLNMRVISGKTMMDRNAPDYLKDTPEAAYAESKQLIKKWHGKDRLLYAVTPRFAPTSSEAQLEVAQTLLKEFPEVYLQTHLAENKNEVIWIKELFPWCQDYTDIYDHYELLGHKTILGHSIYLTDREYMRIHESQSVLSWCPTSNFFLGSGLFNLDKARNYCNRLGIGTDMGGGSSFSMLITLNEAYKTAAIQDLRLSALEGFYGITLGNAKALALDDKIGNFAVGKEADFVALDLQATPLLADKINRANSLEEKLFNLMILGDDRAIASTHILGEIQYRK